MNLISDKEIREKEKTRIQTEFHQKHTKQTASSSSGSPEKNVANTIKTVENPLKEFIHDPREAARRHSPDDLSEISPDYDSIKSKLKELDLKFFRAGKGTHEIWGIEGVEITVILPNIKGAIGTARNVIRRAYLIKDLSEIQKNQASSSGAI